MIESILKGFEIWTNAQGIKSKGRVKSIDNISLEGIAALRQLIIELAVRGKLINQNSDDEPATVLLKEVINNKENLILEGKARKERNDNDDEIADIPFDAPKGWVWVALQTISTINGGYAFKSSSYSDEGYRVIRISDFDEKGFKDVNIVRHKYSDALEPFLLFENNILLAMTGGTVGKSYLVKELNEPMLVNQRVASINLIKPIHEEFIHYVIQSKHVKDVIDEAKNSTNDNISMSDIKGFKIPLPPLAEQIRITEKVNELLSWCDELEEQQTNNLTTHHHLVKCLLETLTNAADTDELQAVWQKLAEHFDTLFCTEYSIEQLKQSILQLAIMGRLVKQDPNDEPVNNLLEKILVEKQACANGKKSKRSSSIIDNLNFLPSTWISVAFTSVTLEQNQGVNTTAENVRYSEKGIPVVQAGNISTGDIRLGDDKFVDIETYNRLGKKFKPKKGEILYSNIGANFGTAAIVEDIGEFIISWNVLRIKPSTYLHLPFIKHWLNNPIIRNYAWSQVGTSTVPFISGKKVEDFVLPLPPIQEQIRIASTIDLLICICESLKKSIGKSQEIRCILSKTIVEQVFE